MKMYDSYKDSGVEWIDQIPSDWAVLKNKYFTKAAKEPSQTGEEDLLSVSEYSGVVPRKTIRIGEDHITRSDSLVGYLVVKKGQLVSNIMLMWKRGLGVSDFNGIVSPAYSVFDFTQGNPRYFHYLYRTDMYISEFRRNSTGVIESRLRLYDDSFGAIHSHFPPIETQNEIVHFLNAKTSLIDSLIEKTQRKIELLKEKRTSLINEAVTKGLNPDVEMKDSGVEWIGEIPNHWASSPLKRLARIGNGRDYKHIEVERGGYPVYGTGGVFSRCSEYLHTGPSVLLGRKGTIDNPLFVKEPFWTSDTIYFTVIDESKIMPSLLFRLVHQIPFDLFSYGSAIPSMTKSDYEEMKFPLPPLSEQYLIVEYLDGQTQKIDKSIAIEEERIKLLKEYRQSLISSVVTGKIKVTEDA